MRLRAFAITLGAVAALALPMPLKIVEQGAGYRLYAGKSFCTVKAQ